MSTQAAERSPCGVGLNDRRIRPAAETRRLLEPWLGRFGITRVGDLTGLDELGLHVTSVTRPASRTIIVFAGKGADKDQAYVSGVMEAIETYGAERESYRRDSVAASFRQLSADHAVLDPTDLILPVGAAVDPETELDWVIGREVTTGRAVYVPEDAVFIPARRSPHLVSPTTNGLCAGSNFTEAVLHGLYEVVERDACSLAEVFQTIRPVVPESVPSARFAEGVDKARRAGVAIRLYSIENALPFPAFICVLEDASRRDPCFFNIGHGAHLDPLVAAGRALLEAAQSRLLYIAGAREDLWEPNPEAGPGRTYSDRLGELGFGFLAGCERPAASFQNLFGDGGVRWPSLEDELSECVRRLLCAGLERVIAVDLTPDPFPFPVLRVIVPGLECYYSDQSRVGPRIRDRLRRSVLERRG